jgi:hypothetical protein
MSLSNCSLQSCAETPARIQRNRRTPTPAKESPDSYRSFTLREFKLLSPPEPPELAIVHSDLPKEDLTFAGWASWSVRKPNRVRALLPAPVHSRDETPAPLTRDPNSTDWSLSKEAERIIADGCEFVASLIDAEHTPYFRLLRSNHHRRMKRPGVRYVLEDERWQDLAVRRKPKPKLAGLTSIQKLMVEAYGLSERDHTQHTIAVELGVTRRQVQTLLRKSGTILTSAATT